jgi:hypothetical protein
MSVRFRLESPPVGIITLAKLVAICKYTRSSIQRKIGNMKARGR